jgi:dolichol-phosphate mannosyltransferase
MARAGTDLAPSSTATATALPLAYRGSIKSPRRWAWLIFTILFSVLAIISYLTWDARTVQWLHANGIDAWAKKWVWLRKLRIIWPGHFFFTLVIALLVVFFHRSGWRGAWLILLAGVITGVNSIIKWGAGRARPDWKTGTPSFDFHPFPRGLKGLFAQENLAFPSGDAALAVATAASLSYLIPKWRPLWWMLAIIVGAQRVAENAHHLSDVLAAAALGLIAFHCARAFVRLSPDHTGDGPVEPIESDGPTRVVKTAANFPVNQTTYLSLVIPCYNEEENVPTLLQRVHAALAQTAEPFEVIVVDDGSTDSTPKLLADAMKSAPWLRVIRMSKNGGQSAAFEAGFEAARGQIIATIDADLQNDPEEIPRLLPLLDEKQVDMITGWRKDRQDTTFRRWQSRQANRIRNWISKETVNDSASSLKIYRAHAIKGLRLFNGAHRFFPTLVKMRGYKVYETPVKHSARFAGTAKYGFRNRALRAFIDLLGVRWMKERNLRYNASEVRPDDGDQQHSEET